MVATARNVQNELGIAAMEQIPVQYVNEPRGCKHPVSFRRSYGRSEEVTGLGEALNIFECRRLESINSPRTDYLGEILPYVPSLLFLIPLLMVSRTWTHLNSSTNTFRIRFFSQKASGEKCSVATLI